MSATPDKPPKADSPVVTAPQPGPVSQWLTQQGFEHEVLEPDHLNIEQIGVESLFLPVIAAALKSHGFDYLQCQGGYDEGPGARLVSFYHLVAMAEVADGHSDAVREVRLKVFLSREGQPSACQRCMGCSVVLTGRSVKPSTCMESTLRVTPIPSVCSCQKIGPAGRFARIMCSLISTKCKTPFDASWSWVRS